MGIYSTVVKLFDIFGYEVLAKTKLHQLNKELVQREL